MRVPPPSSLADTPDKPYEPQRHFPISATTGTYIYPTNRPKRDYQYEIVQACFMDNCLVALPTGLGKTFVAGVVMLNCESAERLVASELTLSLSMVPDREDNLLGAYKAIGQSTD